MHLEVVDLILQAVAPDAEGDPLSSGRLERIPVDVLGLADHSSLLKIMRRHGLSKDAHRNS